ncbi:unnamed protein product, partial [Effrenium voratum]
MFQSVSAKLQPSRVTYNAAISSVGWHHALVLLSALETAAAQPNAVSVSAATAACAKSAEWRRSLRLASGGSGGGAVGCSAAMSSCEKRGQWRHAVALLAKIARADVDCVACGNAVSACAKAGKWLQALAIFHERRQHVQLDLVAFNAAITACEKASEWRQALGLLRELRTRRLREDTVTCSAVVSACVKIWPMALALLAELWHHIRVDVICYAAAISACAFGARWAQALFLLSHCGVLNDVAVDMSLRACEKASQPSQSLHLLARLQLECTARIGDCLET